MFSMQGRQFLRDGSAHLVVSGAIHYSRIHPDQWADRLRRIRHMGANTIETYVPWNFHAASPAVTDFTGPRDLGRFLDLAFEADLDVIARPGPYICAEWEGGGLPGWLLGDASMRLRCSEPTFLRVLDDWFDTLIPIIAERQYPSGGRVVMVQVENEYGSYGEDKAYLAHLRDGLRRRGISVPLVTSDGPGLTYLAGGTIEGALPTLNFGSRVESVMDLFDAEVGDAPPMCMEYWNGWFDHWGEQHHTRPAEEAAGMLEEMLVRGVSVNIYMAIGGTNFGLWNGSNHHEVLQPTVTSYDYDAPISENGALTGKFHAYRDVIARHIEVPPLPTDLAEEPLCLPAIELEQISWGAMRPDDLCSLSAATVGDVAGLRLHADASPFPPTFEDVGLERGLLLLRTNLEHPGVATALRLHGLHDRAHVFCDGKQVGIVGRDEGKPETLMLEANRGNHTLDILVESQGRINFGPLLGERKGILDGVWFGTRFLMGWQAWPLALDLIGAEVRRHVAKAGQAGGLPVWQFALPVAPEHAGRDAFLQVDELERGFVFVGDELLGRHWSIGPQQSLYVPGPLLGVGDNIITVVATDGEDARVRVVDGPLLDWTPPPALD